MSGLGSVDGRTFFVKPIQTQISLVRNQSSGAINNPEAGKNVPGDDAKALITKHHQFLSRETDYIERVNRNADQDKAMTEQLAQYTRQELQSRVGNHINTRV